MTAAALVFLLGSAHDVNPSEIWQRLAATGWTVRTVGLDDGDVREVVTRFSTLTIRAVRVKGTGTLLTTARGSYRPARLVSSKVVTASFRSCVPEWSVDRCIDGSLDFRLDLPVLASSEVETAVRRWHDALAVFAEDHPRDQTDRILPAWLDEKIEVLSERDAEILAERWSWTYSGPWGGSSPSWVVPWKVDKDVLFVSLNHPGTEQPWNVRLAATSTKPAGTNQAKWDDAVAKVDEKLIQQMSDSSIAFLKLIDLRGDIKVRDFKRTVEKFARVVRRFHLAVEDKTVNVRLE